MTMQADPKKILISIFVATLMAWNALAQSEAPKKASLQPGIADTLGAQRPKYELRQERIDAKRARKNLWLSVMGGPSYTPEASFGVGGALLGSFMTDRSDTLAQRSYFPVGLNLTVNGTFVVQGEGAMFFRENRFRIYVKYQFRNEPTNYYGKGFDRIESMEKSDSTTEFTKQAFRLYPRAVWEVRPHLYLGGSFDMIYTRSSDINPVMALDEYFCRFSKNYFLLGLGGLIQFDTRDDVATPRKGVFLSATGEVFNKAFGSKYNYEMVDLEYRQFAQVLRPRSVLAWVARAQMSFGDVPFTELPMFGSPFDLRGYEWGKYRDKSMAYVITEYRHMFGTEEAYRSGRIFAKLGFVVWGGLGTLGDDPSEWTKWKVNYGVGFRFQLQPRKNCRIDIGKGDGSGVLFYMNMTEAF